MQYKDEEQAVSMTRLYGGLVELIDFLECRHQPRSFQVETMGDPVAKNCWSHSRCTESRECIRVFRLHNKIVIREVPYVAASIGARYLIEAKTSTLETLINDL